MTAPRTPSRWLRLGIPILLIAIWFVGGAIGGPYFGKVDEVATNDQSTFLPSTAESTQVQERLTDFTGGDTIPAVVVVTAEGEMDADALEEVQAAVDALADLDGVGELSPAIASEDGEAAQVFVPIDSDGEVRDTVEELRTTLADELPAAAA